MSSIVTQAEFARRLEQQMGRVVNRSTVKRWADDGKIVMQGKKVRLEASLERMQQLGVGQIRTDVAERHREESAHKGPQAAHKASPSHRNAPQAAYGLTDEANSESRTRYKRLARYYQNQSIKLGMALARGQAYWMQDVGAEGLGLGNALRAGIERLIDETAPSLAAMTDARQRQGLLGRETKKLSRILAREYPKALRRLRQGARMTKAQGEPA